MKAFSKKLEALLEKGGTRKDVVLLILSGVALLLSIFMPFPCPLTRRGSQSCSAAFPLCWKP